MSLTKDDKNFIKELLEQNNKKLVSIDDLEENNKNLITKDDLSELRKLHEQTRKTIIGLHKMIFQLQQRVDDLDRSREEFSFVSY